METNKTIIRTVIVKYFLEKAVTYSETGHILKYSTLCMNFVTVEKVTLN